MSTNLPLMGLPGQQQRMIVVNEFKPATDPRNKAHPAGSQGNYKIVFTFSRPGYPLVPENRHSFANGLEGDSHLAITKPAFTPPGNDDAAHVKIFSQTEDGSFEFIGLPNSKGFLGKIIIESLQAQSFEDAEEKAYRALASSLSNWSAHLDIPLNVFQIDSTELWTGNSRMSLTTAFWEAPFAVAPQVTLKPEFRGYASLYREALNSSPVYQFLCFFKIIDGIQKRRSRLGLEARNKGEVFRRPVEAVPDRGKDFETWLNAIFPIRPKWDPMALDSIFQKDALGRKVSKVIEDELRPLRNDIAHALSAQSGELTLSADEALHLKRVNKWLPLTKCIARRMLKNEFPGEFLTYLREDGSIQT